jgi:AraC-like DNA-binding protein
LNGAPQATLLVLPGPAIALAEAVRRIEASDGRQPIGDLAEHLEIGERQLQRRFRRAVGLTPKQFSRIRRFRACARNLIAERPEAWGRVAVAHGYSDQAHLNREFARLSGRSPTQLARYIACIQHEDVEGWGAGVAMSPSRQATRWVHRAQIRLVGPRPYCKAGSSAESAFGPPDSDIAHRDDASMTRRSTFVGETRVS